MHFLNKMERKFGRYAIPELTKYIILCYVIGYALEVFQNMTGVGIMGYLALSPYHILHGQIWRLVSWVLIPPSGLDIFTIIMLLFIIHWEQRLKEHGESSVITCTFSVEFYSL